MKNIIQSSSLWHQKLIFAWTQTIHPIWRSLIPASIIPLSLLFIFFLWGASFLSQVLFRPSNLVMAWKDNGFKLEGVTICRICITSITDLLSTSLNTNKRLCYCLWYRHDDLTMAVSAMSVLYCTVYFSHFYD